MSDGQFDRIDSDHVRSSVRRHWRMFMAQGVILVILGMLAIVWPQISTLAVEIYVGWLFLIGGIVGLFGSFYAPSTSNFLWALVSAALSVLVGVILLANPVQGAISLTALLIGLFVVEGVFQIVLALRHRQTFPGRWVWLLVSGAADLLLAFIIINGWPGASF